MSRYFPTWRYHRERGSKLVKSAEELEKLSAGWHDCPSKVGLVPFERNYAPHLEKAEEPVAEEESAPAEAPEKSESAAVKSAGAPSKPAGPKAKGKGVA